MARVVQVAPLTMEWCLDCHRSPDHRLRPLDQVASMPPRSPSREESLLVAAQLGVEPLTHCTTCHR
jgi:hypothetical protein